MFIIESFACCVYSFSLKLLDRICDGNCSSGSVSSLPYLSLCLLQHANERFQSVKNEIVETIYGLR